MRSSPRCRILRVVFPCGVPAILFAAIAVISVLFATPAPAVPGRWSLRSIPYGPTAAPAPDDTIFVTAVEPYLGVAASGRAFVRLAPGHSALTNPIVVLEGFDLDNSMSWEELYAVLNQEGLAEELRARGFDAVVLDFDNATDYIQRNAFVFTELLRQVEEAVAPDQTVAVVGASMGGLVARYGLSWLESNAVPHRVRTFISFDAPQRGANIPLGLQHWVDFFADENASAEAEVFRDILNSPAARQMLVYHFEAQIGQTALDDGLRTQLGTELAALGGYPSLPRRVAISNGSGGGLGQGYAAGAQLIFYDYDTAIIDVRGHVWAVPDGGPSTNIFQGRLQFFGLGATRTVGVNGTKPYDNAPGGYRASMAQLDTVNTGYGDIVALQLNHCFIPTLSALDLDFSNLFHDVASDPDPLSHSPFDVLYFADTNEEHIHVSATTAARIVSELEQGLVAVGPGGTASGGPDLPVLQAAAPNPFHGTTRLAFVLPAPGAADLRIIAVDGRAVATLAQGLLGAGRHELVWDGRDARGTPAPAGLYFARLSWSGRTSITRLVRVP